MGLFNRYTRPGPGVKKEGAEKRRFVVFFELLFRKFGKLFQLNALFMLFAVLIFAMTIGVSMLLPKLSEIGLLNSFITYLPLVLLAFPLTGMTYVTRNFAREEHAFIASDFFQQIKKNWKVSLLHGVVSYVAYFVCFSAIQYYGYYMQQSIWLAIPRILCILVLILLFMMQYYMFPMIVTFDIPYSKMLKNAAIFSISSIIRNIGISLVVVPVWFVLIAMFYSVPVVKDFGFMVLSVLISFIGLCAITSFLCSFAVYPVLERFMIIPYYQKESAPAVRVPEGTGPVREGDHYQPIENKEEVEYVFENGKLVKKAPDAQAPIFKDELDD